MSKAVKDLLDKIEKLISKGNVGEAEKNLSSINEEKLTDKELYEFFMTNAELMEKKEEDKLNIINYFKDKINSLNDNKYLLLYEIAKIYHYHIGDYNNARTFYTKTIDQLKDDEKVKGEIFFSLGNMYSDNGKYEVSNDYYKESLGVFDKIKTKESIEYVEFIYRLLGSNAEDNNDFSSALEFYKKAERVSQNLHNPGIASYLIASLYSCKLNKEDLALNYALEAEKLISEQIYQIGNYQLLSHLYRMSNYYKKSLSYSQKIINKFPDFENICDIYKDIGKLYCFWKKYDLAIENFKLAINKLSSDSEEYDEKFICYSSWLAIAERDGGLIDKAINRINSIINQYPEKEYNLLFPERILVECMCIKGMYLDAYNLIKNAIKTYGKSIEFEPDDVDYKYAIELKYKTYKKLPIINRLISNFFN